MRGISGRALSKASFDSVVILRGQGLPPMLQVFGLLMVFQKRSEIILGWDGF